MKPVLIDIALRTAIIYSFILVLLRVGGKRQIGQMTPLDLVLLLLISNAVQNAMTGPDTSLMGGVVAAGTLLLVNVVLSRTMDRSRFFRSWLEGTPTILINHGLLLKDHLVRENINDDELMQALRAHGAPTIQDVRLAVLERNGSISVIKYDSPTPHD
jgi:uncharacterized membrane protein YcaP (DUF421 family)